MSLKLYTDKQELFECNIELTGVSLTNSVIRAILEFNDKKILVDGKIKKTASATDGTIADIGQAVIAFPKLKNIADAGDTGNMVLEIIADDAYFKPYQENFVVETSKKATVEIKKATVKPKVVIEKKNNPLDDIVKLFETRGVTKKDLYTNKDKFSKLIYTYYQQSNINESYSKFIKKIINRLN